METSVPGNEAPASASAAVTMGSGEVIPEEEEVVFEERPTDEEETAAAALNVEETRSTTSTTSNNTEEEEDKQELPTIAPALKPKKHVSFAERRRSSIHVLQQYQAEMQTSKEINSTTLPTTNRLPNKKRRPLPLSDSIRLATSEKHVMRAVYAVLFCVFADSINLQCTAPNYPLMVTLGGHRDSFPSTEPLDFAAAQYMIGTGAAMGAFLSNLAASYLSDKYGKRRMILFNLLGSVIFTLAKYFAQNSYWLFTAMTFANALFGSTTSVALAYMGEVFHNDRAKADVYLNYCYATMGVSRSLGGLLTVFYPDQLFRPLIPAAVIAMLGFGVAYKFVLESSGVHRARGSVRKLGSKAELDGPTEMDVWALANMFLGQFADGIGSLGLVPLALSPLMFQSFHNNLVADGLDPIMREQTYRWLYSMVAVLAIPGALISPWMYDKIGIAMTCVVTNFLTGILIVVMMIVALLPPTKLTFTICATLLYVGFPFAFISQMSSGPMADRVTPPDKKGMIMGLGVASTEASYAVFPLVLGLIADKAGIEVTLWICAGISALASIIHIPLVFHPVLRKSAKGDDDDAETVALIDEDELEAKLQRGEYVGAKDLWQVNIRRLERGDGFLYTHVGKYDPDTPIAIPKEEYMYLRDVAEQRIVLLKAKPEHKEDIAAAINGLQEGDEEIADQTKRELGEWMADYLVENGYVPGQHSPIIKAMLQSSFPRLSSKEVSADNVETRLGRIARLMNDYVERHGLDDKPGWFGALKQARKNKFL